MRITAEQIHTMAKEQVISDLGKLFKAIIMNQKVDDNELSENAKLFSQAIVDDVLRVSGIELADEDPRLPQLEDAIYAKMKVLAKSMCNDLELSLTKEYKELNIAPDMPVDRAVIHAKEVRHVNLAIETIKESEIFIADDDGLVEHAIEDLIATTIENLTRLFPSNPIITNNAAAKKVVGLHTERLLGECNNYPKFCSIL